MKKVSKYALSIAATVVVSLTIAAATARASCTIEVTDSYTCYVTGEDANYCYYTCYCKVGAAACDRALTQDGFESY